MPSSEHIEDFACHGLPEYKYSPICPLLISRARNPRLENLGLGLLRPAGNLVGERLNEGFRERN